MAVGWQGIPGLTTFHETVPSATRRQSFHPSKPITLVVDGNGMRMRLYGPHLDWLRGGQFLDLRNSVRDLVLNLRRQGVETVWLFDGAMPDEKHAEWVKRQGLRLTKVHRTFELLCTGQWEAGGASLWLCFSILLLKLFAVTSPVVSPTSVEHGLKGGGNHNVWLLLCL